MLKGVNEFNIEKLDIEGVNQSFKEVQERIQKENKEFKIFSLEEMEQDLIENVKLIQNIFGKIE